MEVIAIVAIKDFNNSSQARTLAISPDGRSVLVVKDIKPLQQLHNLELWDSRSCLKKREFCLTYNSEDANASDPMAFVIRRIAEHFGGKIANVPLMAIFGLAISPDGLLIALACGHDVRIFQIDSAALTCNHLTTFRGHKDDVNYVSFSPDGSLIVSASADGTAILWEVSSRREMRIFGDGEIPLGAAKLTMDNAKLIVGGGTELSRGEIFVWDVITGDCMKRISDFEPAIGCLDLSPDERAVAFSSSEGTVCTLDLSTGSINRFPRGSGDIAAVFYHADGSHIISCSNAGATPIGNMGAIVSRGSVDICGPDMKSPRQLYTAKDGIICAAISPTRDVVAVGFSDKVRLIELS